MLTQIRLLHTNDLHASLDAWPYLAATLRRLSQDGVPTLYLDAGDCLDLSEQVCYLTRGQVCLDLLAAAGCSALACGNNELWRMPVPEVTDTARRSPFPWLCANVRDGEGNPLPGIRDWMVTTVAGVKIGIFSLSDYFDAFAEAFGVQQPALEPTARRCVAELREAGAEIILLLSHMGLSRDREIAAAGYGIDLIIGGHSHTAVEDPETVANVVIAQAESHGRRAGVLDLTIDPATRRIARWEGRLVGPDAQPDPDAVRILEKHGAAAAARLNEVICTLPEALTEDGLAALAAEAMRVRAGGEFGLMIGAQINQGLPAGPVTRRHLMEAMQSLWVPSLLEMEGRVLLDLLAQSQDPAIYKATCRVGGQRPYGLTVGHIFTSNIAKDGETVLIAGEPVEPNRTYRAGGLSMMGYPDSGYPAFAGIRVRRRYLPETVHEVVAAALRGR